MKGISSIHSPTYRHNFMWDIEQVLNYLKIYAPSSEVSLKLFMIETLNIVNFRGCVCDNWKSSFLPHVIFNWRTFLRRVTARWRLQ